MATTKRKSPKATSRKKAAGKSSTKSARKRGKAAAKPRLPAAVPATGPLTLDEARALARARQPAMAARRAMPPAATPASVGQERRKLDQERRAEIARRVREYKATMTLMKQRGARRPARKAGAPGAPAPAMAGAVFAPLQIFAEGDSWFDYPPFLLSGGVIPRLERRLGVPILNLAKAGDEVRYMLGVEERTLLAEHFTNGCPAGGPWDVLLFSGGGNDIVANPMALWVKDWDATVPPEDHLNLPRFTTALDLVRAGYEDLIAMRDKLSPTTHLVFHGYDYAIPDGRGVCFLGPWLAPTFKLHGFPTRAAGFAVTKRMLHQFAAMLTSLAAQPKVSFVNAQGLLPEDPSSWHNELHPSRDGFEQHAGKFYAELQRLFPDRVA